MRYGSDEGCSYVSVKDSGAGACDCSGGYTPSGDEPKVWFPSMQLVAEVFLSDENRALLRTIMESKPESMSALARAAGRTPGNMLRTLKILANYGIVELKNENNLVRSVANATEFEILAA